MSKNYLKGLKGNIVESDTDIIRNEAMTLGDILSNNNNLSYDDIKKYGVEEIRQYFNSIDFKLSILDTIGSFEVSNRSRIIEQLKKAVTYMICDNDCITELSVLLAAGLTKNNYFEIREYYRNDKQMISYLNLVSTCIEERVHNGALTGKLAQAGSIFILKAQYNYTDQYIEETKRIQTDKEIEQDFNKFLE